MRPFRSAEHRGGCLGHQTKNSLEKHLMGVRGICDGAVAWLRAFTRDRAIPAVVLLARHLDFLRERLPFWRFPIFRIHQGQLSRSGAPEFRLTPAFSLYVWSSLCIGVPIAPLIFSASSTYSRVLSAVGLLVALVFLLRTASLYRTHRMFWDSHRAHVMPDVLLPRLIMTGGVMCSYAYWFFYVMNNAPSPDSPPIWLSLGYVLAIVFSYSLLLRALNTLRLPGLKRIYSERTTDEMVRRAIDQICRPDIIPPHAWRHRDDWFQKLYRYAYVDRFFSSRHENEVLGVNLNFVLWLLAPFTLSLIVLATLPGVFVCYMPRDELPSQLPLFAVAITGWSGMALAYYLYLGRKVLVDLYDRDGETWRYQTPGRNFPMINRGVIPDLRALFHGRGLGLGATAALGVVPVYLQVVTSLFS